MGRVVLETAEGNNATCIIMAQLILPEIEPKRCPWLHSQERFQLRGHSGTTADL